MKDEKQFWKLRSITRINEGLYQILFDVDGKPSVELTIKGSFSLNGRSAESVIPTT